jgi:type IV pilus assembly protein PilC
MLKSGLNLNKSLMIISKQTKNKKQQNICNEILKNIEK